jgi:hypothetical protein
MRMKASSALISTSSDNSHSIPHTKRKRHSALQTLRASCHFSQPLQDSLYLFFPQASAALRLGLYHFGPSGLQHKLPSKVLVIYRHQKFTTRALQKDKKSADYADLDLYRFAKSWVI